MKFRSLICYLEELLKILPKSKKIDFILEHLTTIDNLIYDSFSIGKAFIENGEDYLKMWFRDSNLNLFVVLIDNYGLRDFIYDEKEFVDNEYKNKLHLQYDGHMLPVDANRISPELVEVYSVIKSINCISELEITLTMLGY